MEQQETLIINLGDRLVEFEKWLSDYKYGEDYIALNCMDGKDNTPMIAVRVLSLDLRLGIIDTWYREYTGGMIYEIPGDEFDEAYKELNKNGVVTIKSFADFMRFLNKMNKGREDRND